MRHSKETKSYITEFAFEIDRSLMGKALATPSRRLLALLIDLFIAAVFTQLGSLSLGLAVGVVFYWLMVRKPSASRWRRFLRYSAAFTGAFILFLTTVSILENQKMARWQAILSDDNTDSTQVNWAQFGKLIATTNIEDVDDLEKLEDDENMEEVIKRLKKWADKRSEILNNADTLSHDQRLAYLNDYLYAEQQQDSVAIARTKPLAQAAIAGKTIAENQFLNERIDELQEDYQLLQQQLNNPSFLTTLQTLASDFGLSIGWIGIYFTLALAFWSGQTPGKRLMNIRVVRLNGKPLTLWHSFERFAGYAAGLATGLLGFAQSYWDPNRQAIHDKIAGTVVIDLKKPSSPRESD
ncbi:MAG: RDD family protein [Bacteroidota bacterium]